ncbi:hypothetical protein IGS61_00350 [Janthinobacterium sp. FW305-129]|uniref:retron St85 family effector protein n=1 Tax=Janthinobacterium sp. FW305-129 TaxID=2775054 RepID=UPI001E3C6735|nr:retron St85 family effector protein [Janthinobacterium sp. FW305-129]MCC7595912.1 hypothetical protein [Janthinobacterium sp. FW305-129]
MSEQNSDPRQIFLSKINVDSLRVDFNETHVVLLCGGIVKYKEREGDDEPPILSLRHAITHANPDYETYRPEDITDWHSYGIFQNLMSFEEDLAGICSLVAIILESPGSIAELGAFSQLPELSKKIIAIKSRDFETTKDIKSFINLGILKFLKDNSENCVRNYPWALSNPATITEQVVNDVIDDIQADLDNIPKHPVFKKSLNSHIAVLICELINLFTAIKETEISEYLEFFGINLGRDAIRRKLFLLEKFRLIKKETYSDSTFFLIGKFKYHGLRISLKDSVHDALRTQVECLEFYKSDKKQRNRARAIQQAASGLQK